MALRPAVLAGLGLLLLAGIALAFLAQGRGSADAAPSVMRAPFPVKRCINMGNGLEAPVEGAWGYRVEASHFAEIRAAGFDTVRIPIKWSAHAAKAPPHTIDPAFFSRIDDVIAAGLGAGLGVIINVHHYDELYADPDAHEDRLVALWDQIARRYSDRPAALMFEIINEPRDAFSGERINRVQRAALALIRQSNPTRTVILAGDRFGNLEGLAALRMPDDPHVVATVHYYSPYEFTHQGASWLKDAPPPGRPWPKPGEPDRLSRDMAAMVDWQQRQSVALFLGEFGTDAAVPQEGRVSWTRDVRLAVEAAGLPWCVYNFAGGFPLYDVPTRQWNAPLLDALGMALPAKHRDAAADPVLKPRR